eukprot:GEMP01025513.1.p2 GENE.GEMP01025513.1~~GEMP01025513.1.p2  ORF type:complete len:108 (-),score=8.84 GEMP01025513.1:1938-2261(-)
MQRGATGLHKSGRFARHLREGDGNCFREGLVRKRFCDCFKTFFKLRHTPHDFPSMRVFCVHDLCVISIYFCVLMIFFFTARREYWCVGCLTLRRCCDAMSMFGPQLE